MAKPCNVRGIGIAVLVCMALLATACRAEVTSPASTAALPALAGFQTSMQVLNSEWDIELRGLVKSRSGANTSDGDCYVLFGTLELASLGPGPQTSTSPIREIVALGESGPDMDAQLYSYDISANCLTGDVRALGYQPLRNASGSVPGEVFAFHTYFFVPPGSTLTEIRFDPLNLSAPAARVRADLTTDLATVQAASKPLFDADPVPLAGAWFEWFNPNPVNAGARWTITLSAFVELPGAESGCYALLGTVTANGAPDPESPGIGPAFDAVVNGYPVGIGDDPRGLCSYDRVIDAGYRDLADRAAPEGIAKPFFQLFNLTAEPEQLLLIDRDNRPLLFTPDVVDEIPPPPASPGPPEPDPVAVERRAVLDEILVDYPGVTGEIFGEVVVLNGAVSTNTELAELDQAVRAVGFEVQNNVVTPEVPTYSVMALIDAQPELSTLRSLIEQAGLEDALAGSSEFTLFAPTNDAFAAVSAEIAAVQADPAALQDLLLYHLLPGSHDQASLATESAWPTLLAGTTLAIAASGNGGPIIVNDTVPVLVSSETDTGVMHVIARVLFPPG